MHFKNTTLLLFIIIKQSYYFIYTSFFQSICRHLRDKGEDDKMPPIRKRQRGLLLRLQQEKVRDAL